MKEKAKRVAVFLVLGLFISGMIAPDVFAQTPIRKLGRGLANFGTGILELPYTVVDVAEEEGYLAAVTYGVVKGIAMSLLRIGIGVYETVTFIIPLPWRYAPILEPEFMMSEDTF